MSSNPKGSPDVDGRWPSTMVIGRTLGADHGPDDDSATLVGLDHRGDTVVGAHHGTDHGSDDDPDTADHGSGDDSDDDSATLVGTDHGSDDDPDTADHGSGDDSDTADHDSAHGVDELSDTQSVTSSVYQYPEQFERTYHAYREGSYQYPNDALELGRNDKQHYILGRLLNRLYLAPISENPQRVLDVGTGTGIWAIQFADLHPSAIVTGIDLSPTQPELLPVNFKNELDDANLPWTFLPGFNLIHCRNLYGAVAEERLYEQSLAALTPGGWLEATEIAMLPQSDDGSLKGTLLEQWSSKMLEASKLHGTPLDNYFQYERIMKEAKFQNVRQVRYKLPIGGWARDEDLKHLGRFEKLVFEEGLHGFTVKLWTKYLKWSEEAVNIFLATVRTELQQNRKIHAYLDVFVVLGQKPVA